MPMSPVAPSACINEIVFVRPGGGRGMLRVQLAMLLLSWCHWWPGWKLDAVVEKTFMFLAGAVGFNDWCIMVLMDPVLLAAAVPVRVVAMAEATTTDDASDKLQE